MSPSTAPAPVPSPRQDRHRQPRVPWSGSSQGTCGLVSPRGSLMTAQNSHRRALRAAALQQADKTCDAKTSPRRRRRFIILVWH